MTGVRFSKNFTKQYKKLPKNKQLQFDKRFRLWQAEPTNSLLKAHKLRGKFADYYSINVTADIRAVYFVTTANSIVFDMIGSHSQLYG